MHVVWKQKNQRHPQPAEKRLAFLQKMQPYQTVLFGKPSASRAKKEAVWKELLPHAKSLGLVAEDRDVSFLRKDMFGRWKNEAKQKAIANVGKDAALTPADKLLLEMTGVDVAAAAAAARPPKPGPTLASRALMSNLVFSSGIPLSTWAGADVGDDNDPELQEILGRLRRDRRADPESAGFYQQMEDEFRRQHREKRKTRRLASFLEQHFGGK